MPEAPRTPLQKALRKRANALRSVSTAERAVARWRARVAELDAEIASYGGRKQAPLPLRLPFRANGEVERAIFDLLRERREITTADVAERLATVMSLDASDEHTAWALRQRAAQAFKRCERKAVVKWVGGLGKGGSFKRWALAAARKPASAGGAQ